jgi:hypothetical protein
MAQKTLTIDLPRSTEALHNLLQMLLQYGLITEKKARMIEQDHEEKASRQSERSRWAQLADEIHQKGPLKGKSEEFLKSVREFRENFSF